MSVWEIPRRMAMMTVAFLLIKYSEVDFLKNAPKCAIVMYPTVRSSFKIIIQKNHSFNVGNPGQNLSGSNENLKNSSKKVQHNP